MWEDDHPFAMSLKDLPEMVAIDGPDVVSCNQSSTIHSGRGPTTGEPRVQGTVTSSQICQIGLTGLNLTAPCSVLDFLAHYDRRSLR